MLLKHVYKDSQTKIFVVTDQDDEDELKWVIEPTDLELIPDDENMYFVKALQVSSDKTASCFLGIVTPERIAEMAIIQTSRGQVSVESIDEMKETIIPAMASECHGIYELYYAKANPQPGIDILKHGLEKAINKNVVAEDLGYILRDEKRFQEAIDAFKISEEYEPSSAYIYHELSALYKELGQTNEQSMYEQMFKDAGGME